MDNINNIKIINQHAYGIQNKINELEEMLNRLRIDLCLITEIKLVKNKSIGNLKNYDLYRADRNSNIPGGGVAILVNKKFSSTENIINVPGLKEIIKIEALASKLHDTIFIVAYKPPKPEIDSNEIKVLFMLRDGIILIVVI